ncbi:DUF3037 domain-containing protein [Ignatzschineria larvae DSM 13226]|uniref:DUF3037 domain-containing protein n=2 Tax=Ignatzschineria larvae TaxID=112009 RepID=A0ABZ3C2E6_9GAMM
MGDEMNQKVALRYAVIQFMPYIETREFANVGVVAVCPNTGYFDYKLITKYQRLTKFFRELKAQQCKASLKFFEQELLNIKNLFANERMPAEVARSIFDTLTRDREAIVRTSNISVRMVANEAQALNQLFDYYVNHNFVEENNEQRLTDRVTALVKSFELDHPFHRGEIGNEDFKISFPLIQRDDNREPHKIIKPLYLGPESKQIYEKSDSWMGKIVRLKRLNFLKNTTNILFAFEKPQELNKSQERALKCVLQDMKDNNIQVADYQNQEQIYAFSTQCIY